MAGALRLPALRRKIWSNPVVLLRLKKNRPNGAIFRREPGLQRGRRRAPFARSREGSAHIKVRLWRTEHVHRSCIYLPQPEGKGVILMAGALRLPTLQKREERYCRAGKRSAPASNTRKNAPHTPPLCPISMHKMPARCAATPLGLPARAGRRQASPRQSPPSVYSDPSRACATDATPAPR